MAENETTPDVSPGGFEGAMTLAESVASYRTALDTEDDAAEAAEAAPEATEEGAEVEAEAAPDETAETTDEANAETTEEEPKSLETLAELAEQLDVPIEALTDRLTHTFKAAGEEHTVSLDKLVEGYQLRQDYDRSKTKLAQTRTRLEQEAQTRIATVDSQLESLGAQLNVMDQMLEAKKASPEMTQLRINDPAEWSARGREIDMQKAELTTTWQGAVQQRETLRQTEQTDFYKRQGEILRDSIDGWGNEKADLAIGVIKELGFEDSELPKMVDHRLIKGALEMHALRDEVQTLKSRLAKGEKAAAKVKREVPKMVKPGAKKTLSVGSAALDKARAAVKRNPSIRNQAELWALESPDS